MHCFFVQLGLAFQKLINLKLTIIFYESQEKGYQNQNELKKGIWSNLSYYPITKGSKNMNQINLGHSHNRCNEVKTIFKTLSIVVSATLNNVLQTSLLTYRQMKRHLTDRLMDILTLKYLFNGYLFKYEFFQIN